jgi:hypothetical protein
MGHRARENGVKKSPELHSDLCSAKREGGGIEQCVYRKSVDSVKKKLLPRQGAEKSAHASRTSTNGIVQSSKLRDIALSDPFADLAKIVGLSKSNPG